MTTRLDRYATSRAAAARAQGLVAGGQHLSGRALLPEQPPIYFERGKGCRVLDVDGNEYIDYLLAYGAIVLGYADDEVDAAAFAQARQGQLLSLNHRVHLEFTERLLQWFPAAEQAMFMKTGSEATTAALRIARRATGRRRVIRCGYHGWHDWCLPLEGWVPDGLDAQVLEFDANDPEGLTALFDAYPGEIAAVIVAPEMVLPSRGEPLHRIAQLTRRAGAVFVLDEVKTAFRIRPGSIQQRYDLQPDLTTVSKALGNGWPVAAVLGTRAVMEHASGMHCSATYHGEVSGMAAAMRTLELIEERGVLDHVWTQGERLLEGFERAAARHGLPIEMFGEPLPPMPMLRVTAADAELRESITRVFFGEMMALGVLLHPRHLWFLCAEHSAEDVRQTIDAADQAMALAARSCGPG